jgi:methionine biosynthesis protein MetW
MVKGDNRAYVWDRIVSIRPEYPYIERWIPAGARVVDLGCGNGSLLTLLKERKNVTELGIEIAPSGVAECRRRGLNAREGRIDVALTDIADQSFDYAICNVTLQMVLYPEVTLDEMRRVARQQIVSFPNFAFVVNRLELLLLGRMPHWGLFGYTWYNTGHIHQFSLGDFRALAHARGLTIRQSVFLGKFANFEPDLLAQTAILLLESA